MIVKLLTEHPLEFLSLKGGCRGSSESTHVKMPNCWKSHALAQLYYWMGTFCDVFELALEFVVSFKKKQKRCHHLPVGRECYYRRADYPVLLRKNVRRFASKYSFGYCRLDNRE